MCKREFLFYRDNETVYTDAGNLTFDNFCNGWVIKNTGNTLVIVDNKETLQPGESKSFGGNVGEVYRGQKRISFQLPAVVPATIVNMATVTEKIYVTLNY